MLRHADIHGPPEYHVDVANAVAHEGARTTQVRALAARIARGLRDVPAEAPVAVADWIRKNVLYTQEAAGEEILQGPLTTLRVGTGDCDDLVILWASLLRALGLPAQLAGLRRPGADGFYHAVGYLDGRYYELSLDHTYGAPRRPVHMTGIPAGHAAYTSDPLSGEGGYSGGMGKGPDGAALNAVAGIDTSLFGNGRVADAANFVVRSAAVSSSAMSAAASLSAAPPVGTVVAAAAFAGMFALTLARKGKLRRRGRMRGNEVVRYADLCAQIMGARNEREFHQYRAGLIEAIPHMAGTFGLKGRRTRKVRIATYQDWKPREGAVWADGTARWRMGVFEVYRRKSGGAEKAEQVMVAHRNTARAFLEGVSQLPLRQRREAFAAMVQTYLGTRAMRAYPWLRPVSGLPTQRGPLGTSSPWITYGVPAAGAGLLLLTLASS